MADNIPPPPPGFTLDQATGDIPPPPLGFTLDGAPPETTDQGFNRGAGLTTRAILHGVAYPSELAADTGVAVRNYSEQLANRYLPGVMKQVYGINSAIGSAAGRYLGPTAENVVSAVLPPGPPNGYYDLPSVGYEQGITQLTGTAPPRTWGERLGSIVTSAVAGAKMPAPEAATQAPTNFVRTTPKTQTFLAGANEGYTADPAAVNPTLRNRMISALAGKKALEQASREGNTEVSSQLANRNFGLPEAGGAPTLEDLAKVRAAEGPAYQAVKALKPSALDSTLLADLGRAAEREVGASEIGGPFAESPLIKYVDAIMKQENLRPGAALDASSVLRGKADAAAVAGDTGLASSYRAASKALERWIDRVATAQGQPDVARNFQDARKVIAQTYDVARGINDAAGTFDPNVLGRIVKKGGYLTGDLKTMGDFAAAFPKYVKPMTDAPIRYTDVMAPAALALLSGHVAPLAIPFAREATRSALLSPAGQQMALQAFGQGVNPSAGLAAFYNWLAQPRTNVLAR